MIYKAFVRAAVGRAMAADVWWDNNDMKTTSTVETVVCCTEIEDPRWRWIEKSLDNAGLTFEITRCTVKFNWAKRSPLNLSRIRGAFRAVRLARRGHAKVLVAQGPTLAAWCSIFARITGLKTPIVAHSFNFTALPPSIKRRVFTYAFSTIDRFVVYSSVERNLYARTFDIPVERFDVVLWGAQPPSIDAPTTAVEPGRYVSAIGGNGRDFRILLETARRLPDVRFVLVVRPESLRGLRVPINVKVHINVPLGTAMNILWHSQFMVLPLAGTQVPCGHVTLVAAMHLGKAFLITESIGVQDYVRPGENALTARAGSIDDFANATSLLWSDPDLCSRLAENGRRFAAEMCTEERIVEHFRGWLDERNAWEIHGDPDQRRRGASVIDAASAAQTRTATDDDGADDRAVGRPT